MAGWFARDPIEFILVALVVVSIPVALVIYLWSRIQARRDPIEPRKELVVRHLLGKGFVLSDTGGMVIWPVDPDLEMTHELLGILKGTSQDEAEARARMVECYDRMGLCGIVGRHIVMLHTNIRSGGPNTLVLWVYLDQINARMGYDANLDLCTVAGGEGPEEGAERFDSGHVGFDSFFVKRQASFEAVKRFQDAADRLDGVARFASSWGPRTSFVGVTRHIRLHLAAYEVLYAPDPVKSLDDLMEAASRLAETFEAVLDPSFVGTRPDWLDRPVFVRVQMLGRCPRCNAGMPINGPVARQQCHGCLESVTIDGSVWKLLAAPYEDFLEREGEVSHGWGDDSMRLKWKVDHPTCPKCAAGLPVDLVQIGTTGIVRCPGCGAGLSTFPAPGWLREAVPGVEQVYGAEGMPKGDDAPKVDRPTKTPTVMTCPGCGGSLALAAESERTVRCEYCGVDVLLPDEIMTKLHPVRTSETWWIRYAAPLPAAKSPDGQPATSQDHRKRVPIPMVSE